MRPNTLKYTVSSLHEQMVSLAGTSRSAMGTCEKLYREAESLKMDALMRLLEGKRVSQARRIGFMVMRRDSRTLGIGLALAIGQSLLQGTVSKNNTLDLGAGLAGLNRFAQGLGYSKWAVSLDKQFIVVPYDKVFAGHSWVMWESLHFAIQELKQSAIAGEKLGDLDSVMNRLKSGKPKLVHLFVPVPAASANIRFVQWHPVTK